METKSQNPIINNTPLNQTKHIIKTIIKKSKDGKKKPHFTVWSHTPIFAYKTKKQASIHALNLAIAYPEYQFYLSKDLPGYTEIIKLKTDRTYDSETKASDYIQNACNNLKIAA